MRSGTSTTHGASRRRTTRSRTARRSRMPSCQGLSGSRLRSAGGYGKSLAVAREFEPSKLGGKLGGAREKRGISLRELAGRVGVSPSLVSQIELDRVNPSVSTLYSLVPELGMTMSEVLGDSEPVEPVARA